VTGPNGGGGEFGRRNLSHLSFEVFRDLAPYRSPSRKRTRKPLRDDYTAHAQVLLDQLTAALAAAAPSKEDTRLTVPGLQAGSLVEVATMSPVEGSRVKAVKLPPAIEFPREGIVVLRSQRQRDRSERRARLSARPDQRIRTE
jgi:hypothetical protein